MARPSPESAAGNSGLTVVDRDTIRAAALQAGIPADLLQRLMYEGQRNVADEILQAAGQRDARRCGDRGRQSAAGRVRAAGLHGVDQPRRKRRRAVGRIIQDIAARGNVLILGQGGQALLQGQPGACHVLFVAPLDVRVANVAQWHNLIDARRAATGARRTTSRATDYLARYHNVRWLDPLLYHLVINTGLVTGR